MTQEHSNDNSYSTCRLVLLTLHELSLDANIANIGHVTYFCYGFKTNALYLALLALSLETAWLLAMLPNGDDEFEAGADVMLAVGVVEDVGWLWNMMMMTSV